MRMRIDAYEVSRGAGSFISIATTDGCPEPILPKPTTGRPHSGPFPTPQKRRSPLQLRLDATCTPHTSMDEFLIGSCELQLSKIHFIAGREAKRVAITKLVERFKISCDPQDHQIPIVVSPEELQVVLSESHVSLDDIVQRRIPRPKLNPSRKLCGIHARQRYEAAIRVFGPNMWWTVRVYCIPAGSNISELLPKETDQFYYQTPPSDGEVFLKVREYEESDRAACATLWRLKLSTCKQVALGALERQEHFLEKFDQLRAFPGLWEGFQLGNIQRCNALYATEEILHYLQHIRDIWERLTLYDPVVQQATDVATVQNLELLAPAISSSDGDKVRELMESRQLFRNICDSGMRNRLQDAILQISVLIPSIRTFHENMKLLTIGMMILRDHVLEGLGARSVRAAMAACWEPPGVDCIVEYRENVFHEVDIRPTFEIAYRQVFMAALRNFPQLSATPPRCERGQKALTASIDSVHLATFLHGVQKQGFRSQKVTASVNRMRACPRLPPHADYEAPFAELALKRRCGRPFAKSCSILTARFFLPNVFTDRWAKQPCTLFVQEDFMCSFFGEHSAMMRSFGTGLRHRQQAAELHDMDFGTSSFEPSVRAVENSSTDTPWFVQSQGWSSPALVGPQRTSHNILRNASSNLTSPSSSGHVLSSQAAVVSLISEGNTSVTPSSSSRHRARNVDIDTLHLLDPPPESTGRRHSVQSVPSNTAHSAHSSTRSLLQPESLDHTGIPTGHASSPSRQSARDLQLERRTRRFWSPPQSSNGSRSIYSPRQWFPTMSSQHARLPTDNNDRPSSPETLLHSSGTSFSSRSLILPDTLRPSYVLRDQRGDVIPSLQDTSAQYNREASSWEIDSSRSEDDTRSIFGPEELRGIVWDSNKFNLDR